MEGAFVGVPHPGFLAQFETGTHSEDALGAAYAQANSRSPDTIVLNFGDVPFMDTTGIALIVGLLAQARKVRRRLRVCGLSAHYVELFQITRLADFMHIFSDEASALAGSPTSWDGHNGPLRALPGGGDDTMVNTSYRVYRWMSGAMLVKANGRAEGGRL